MKDFDQSSLPVAAALTEVRARVDARLESACRSTGLASAFTARSSGKNLRSAMLLLVARLFGGDEETAVRLAADVELLHEASLIHDDVLDGAAVRRGVPSAASVLGASDAVLLGDVIFMGVFEDAVGAGVPGALPEITRASALVCAGEVREHRARGDFSLSRREYMRIVDMKTASLYRASGRIGALAGGASQSDADSAARFGRWVGLAFQAADDLLDVTGDEARAGKPLRSDLAALKVTLPTILHLERLGPGEREAAVERLAARDPAAVEEALAAMLRPEAVAAVRRVAATYCRRALKTLDSLPVGLEKADLAALCRFAADRSF